jgi:hypothetical protein
MRATWPLTLGSVLYAGLAVFLPVSMFWWTEYAGRPFSTLLFVLVAALSLNCALVAFAGYKARNGSNGWARSFAVAAAALIGITSFANWKGLLIFGLPFLVALWGLWNVYKNKHAG